MSLRRRSGFRAIAILLACALVQLSLQLSFAEPTSSSFPTIPPQGLLGRITTKGNLPASINGNNAASGDSVASGSLVETPNSTEATVDLGPLGSIEFAPGTRARIDYACPVDKQSNPDPESCNVSVTLFAGCVISNYRQGTRHRIDNDKQAKLAQSDADKEKSGGGILRMCSNGVPAGAAATTGGIGKKGVIAILIAAVLVPTTIVLIAAGEDNPSPSTP
jgi:hypothetical protein